jgi:long-chain acyl-CoA synthetase
MLQNTAQNFPNHRAIFWVGDGNPRFLSWREYLARISKTAGLLKQLGLVTGDRFALISRNIPYAGELINAGYWTGVIPVPINFRLSHLEISQVLNDAHCKMIFIEDVFVDLIGQINLEQSKIVIISIEDGGSKHPSTYPSIDTLRARAQDVNPISVHDDDDAICLFTGGTTARGKGVRLSHRNIISNALQISNLMRTNDRDVYLHISPMFHSTDLKATVVTMFGGGHVYLPEYSTQAVLDAIEQHEVSILSLVPTTLIRFLKEADFVGRDLSSLRLISYGTSPMDDNWLKFALEKLPQVEFHQCYGLTETTPYLSILDGNDHTKALQGAPHLLLSAGKILPATQMRIINDDGLDVAFGVPGELIVRGPQVSKGYMNAPEEMARAFVNGWFHTGDIAQLDEEGYLYIRDRKKEMVKTGGENVYTREVEVVLLKHPKIMEVAVVGIPDPDYGESLLAIIVPKAGIDSSDPEISSEFLIQFCREYLGGYKIPRKHLVVDQLPRTALGKVKKTALKELFSQQGVR